MVDISEQFEEAHCIICKRKTPTDPLWSVPDYLTKSPGIFTLVQCRICRLAFQNPRPKERHMHSFAPKSWHRIRKYSHPKIREGIRKHILMQYYGYQNLGRKNIIAKALLYPAYAIFFRYQTTPMYVPNGRLLEIGCGIGTQLAMLQKSGWNAQGIEINSAAAEHARNAYQLRIHHVSVLEADFPPNSFHAVIMTMVLANLHHPDAVLKKITSWLKPGGQLIFSDPAIEGVEYRLFGPYTYSLQLPTHIYFLTKRHIQALLSPAMSDIRFVFHNTDEDIVLSTRLLHEDTKKLQYKILGWNPAIRWILIKPFVFAASLMGKTSRMTIFATKKQ